MLKIPKQPEINIGTAGHVDHGKTTLVEAITGIWTSKHSEELRRGITIRVGYADAAIYKCKSCGEPECYSASPQCPRCGKDTELRRVISFVDCPGHESLMVNMLSGAALMDGALLVIASNERVPQPQTREHLLALQMMGMKHLVIVQNKVELISDDEAFENYRQIRNFVRGTMAEGAPIIPVSAQHKLNINAVLQALEEHIPTPKRDISAKALMQILRSFDINRPGISPKDLKGGVLGGSLIQGKLRVNEEIEIRPGIIDERTQKSKPLYTKISSLATSAGFVDEVTPGGLIAIGTLLDPYLTKSDALLGSVVGRPNELPDILESLNIKFFLFDTAVGTKELIKVEPIKLGEHLRLNIGTAATLGIVERTKSEEVFIKLKRPVCSLYNSRVAISRKIGDRWRLIGSGIIKE
ncbi:MAG: translation initiation factor IF-2 subunit gamma [Nitrososphaerales archaeon]